MKGLLFYLVVGLICLLFFYASHEETHREIYTIFGLNSSTSWEGTHAVTHAQGACSDACKEAQSNAESVGYHLFYLLGMVYIGFAFVVYYLELLSGNKKTL